VRIVLDWEFSRAAIQAPSDRVHRRGDGGEHAEAPWRRAEFQREEGHVRLQHLLPGAIFSKRVSNDFLISVKIFCALLP